MKKLKTTKLHTGPERRGLRIAADIVQPRFSSFPQGADAVRAVFGPCCSNGYGGNDSIRTAQDAALDAAGVYSLLAHSIRAGMFDAAPQFVGYGILSQLTQDGLIRAGVEMRADEMTRRWIELTYTGKADENADRDIISDMTAGLDRLNVRHIFRAAAAMSGYFGGCLVYLDTGDLDARELKEPLRADPDTFRLGSLRGLRIVEPFNISPGRYDAAHPLNENYFVPQTWLIMGTEVHASRFLYFAEDRPPTLLLPSYNFFGIPLAQVVLDVVTHFTQCREAAARLMTKFSLTVLKTDLQAVLTGGPDSDIQRRIAYMVQNRDNDGVEAIDKETEDIVNITTPLTGITEIVRQAEEMVAAYFGEPAVKLWGLSPGGFNSTGEADMQNHYDHIASIQERMLRQPLARLLELMQMNIYGKADPALGFTFAPLGDDDDRAIADINNVKADAACKLFDRGIVSGEEVRQSLADDPRSPFTNIDADELPEQPDDEILPAEELPEAGETAKKAADKIKLVL